MLTMGSSFGATDSSPESNLALGHIVANGSTSTHHHQDNSPGSNHLTSDSTSSHYLPGQSSQALNDNADNTRRTNRKRKKTFSREDRALHSVIEKHRRESFNELLSQLASIIPNQSMSKKPSKGVIVRASIAHHGEQRQRALTASVEIRKLLAERADLLREVNSMRQKLGGRGGPRTLDRDEEQSRQKDRQDIFDVETERFFDECNTSTLDSTDRDVELQIRTFLELQQQERQMPDMLNVPPIDASTAAASFTSPTPSQLTRFLEHVDSDLLHFLPS